MFGLTKKIPLELLFFSVGLTCLFFLNVDKAHASLCPFAHFGFKYCPGCGLGHSLHYLMHLQFSQSWKAHPLGIFAFVVIIHRIYTLIIKTLAT